MEMMNGVNSQVRESFCTCVWLLTSARLRMAIIQVGQEMQPRKGEIKLQNRISRLSEVDISIIQCISIVSHWSQWPPEEQGQQVRERREAVKDFSSHTAPLCKAPGSLWLLAPFIHTWICSAIFGYRSDVLDETSEDKVLTYIWWLDEWIHEGMNEDFVFKVMSLLSDLIQVIFCLLYWAVYTRRETEDPGGWCTMRKETKTSFLGLREVFIRL